MTVSSMNVSAVAPEGYDVNNGVRSNGWRCYNYNAVKGG